MYSARSQSQSSNCVEQRSRLESCLPLSHEPRVRHTRTEMFPYHIDANEQHKANSRLDPTLAYPVPLRPSVFQHARFIDKMQPAIARVKQEKFEATYQEEPFSDVDPRRWTREDVSRWLEWTSEVFNLGGAVRTDRFQMNGKALCLMTMDMFLYRVPEGGNLLYQDFQRRLRNAVTLQN